MPDASHTPPRRRTHRVETALAALVTLALMLATEPRLAIAWDEGYSLGRIARVRAWFRLLIDPGRCATWHEPAEFDLTPPDRDDTVPVPRPPVEAMRTRSDLLRPEAIAWFWPFAREEPHGHPPVYAWAGLIGDAVTPWRSPLERARFGPIVIFSLMAGGLFASLASRWGRISGLTAVAAWVLHPHLFALGHYAHYDALLSCWWVGAILAFAAAIEPTGDRDRPRRGPMLVFGLMLGLALATKFTGWFLPLPFLAWALLQRDRRALVTLMVGGAIAIGVLYLLTPPFWHHPFLGVRHFLESNLTRSKTIPLPVLFLGEVIKTPVRSLPWYNTLLWTAIATPVGLLALGLLGAARAVRRSRPGVGSGTGADSLATLVLVNWVFLLVLRALPHTPGHDGVRLFLPAFGCLALLAGLGARVLVERAGRCWSHGLVLAAVMEAGVSLAMIMPVPLSYFSPLVDGLPGAVRIGMEPTYYWDALDARCLAWLDTRTPADHKVQFSTYPLALLYLRQTGQLTAEVRRECDRPVAWYVLQNRPGMFQPIDRVLLARGRPAFSVRKAGVPLILVYPEAERERLSSVATRFEAERPARR